MKAPDIDIKDLRQYIDSTEDLTFVQGWKASGDGKLRSCICELQLEESAVPIVVAFDNWFPIHPPKFVLGKFDELGFIPHIEPKGAVCYLERESVYINYSNPELVFQASCEMVRETLVEGLSGENMRDFTEEFSSYWERNEFIRGRYIISKIQPSTVTKEIHLLVGPKTVLASDDEQSPSSYPGVFQGKRLPKSDKGLYIPLEPDIDIIPPKYDQRWSSQEFLDWLTPKVSQQNWNLIREMLAKNFSGSQYRILLLGIPRRTGPTLIVAVSLISPQKRSHVLQEKYAPCRVDLHLVGRLDKEAHLPRSGGMVDLQEKKVLLIGCGSVGSHIAIALAKLGVGQLTLLDDDSLSISNIQRYALGLQYTGRKKVIALGQFVALNYPLTTITPVDSRLEDFLENHPHSLKRFDIVISAIGDPTFNLPLNEFVKKDVRSAPFVVCWNEPLGIGGHSLISLAGDPGCYNCLYRDNYNIASFAHSEQPKPFHIKHLGCGEVYTPYTVMDSIRTTELAVRQVTEYFTGQIETSKLLSWKGNSNRFVESGFRVSSRYEKQSQHDMDMHSHDFMHETCPHCNRL